MKKDRRKITKFKDRLRIERLMEINKGIYE